MVVGFEISLDRFVCAPLFVKRRAGYHFHHDKCQSGDDEDGHNHGDKTFDKIPQQCRSPL